MIITFNTDDLTAEGTDLNYSTIISCLINQKYKELCKAGELMTLDDMKSAVGEVLRYDPDYDFHLEYVGNLIDGTYNIKNLDSSLLTKEALAGVLDSCALDVDDQNELRKLGVIE